MHPLRGSFLDLMRDEIKGAFSFMREEFDLFENYVAEKYEVIDNKEAEMKTMDYCAYFGYPVENHTV